MEWKTNIVNVKMIGVQIIALKFIVECNTFNVISACAPCIELEKHLKIKFWEELEGLLNSEYTTGRKDFSRGDLNSKDDNWTQARWTLAKNTCNGLGKTMLL